MNSYAIVAYLAGPLARFADRLRSDLEPGASGHAHITILPPRPVKCPVEEAIEFARQQVAKFEPFTVEIGGVEAFSETQVVYLSLRRGAAELIAMHGVLNTGVLEQDELHHYVPHLTLGKHLPAEAFRRSLDMARECCRDFAAQPLRVDTVTFVQERVDQTWVDLAELGLGRVPAVG